MPRKFSSFLIRWWRSDDDERLELQHIQTGRRRVVNSVSDAASWIEAEADRGVGEEDRPDPDNQDLPNTDLIEHD